MVLQQIFIDKALQELGETDERRSEALIEFRAWIESNEIFKNCRKDDNFLLRFLRSKKFQIKETTILFEHFMSRQVTFSKWFKTNKADDVRMWKLFDCGVVVPLIERDSNGRQVILIQPHRIDTKTVKLADVVRLLAHIACVLLEEEETQIAGMEFIVDQTGITLKHVDMFSIADVRDFVSFALHAAVGRQKGMYMVNLPYFAKLFLDIAKMALSEKLRKRLHLIKDMEQLKLVIEEQLLPKELNGGSVTESEMLENFRKIAEGCKEKILLSDSGIDYQKILDKRKSSCAMM